MKFSFPDLLVPCSVMIEELSSLQGSLQSSLVESRGVIHELLTEQRQVFGDLQFSYQQLSSACLRLQDSMNTTSAVPSLYSGASPSTAPGHFEITTQQLSRHCIQLAAWCSKHLASLLQAIRGPSGTPSLPAVGESKQQKAHHVHVAMPDPHAQSLDNVQWRPSNAEAIAHQVCWVFCLFVLVCVADEVCSPKWSTCVSSKKAWKWTF